MKIGKYKISPWGEFRSLSNKDPDKPSCFVGINFWPWETYGEGHLINMTICLLFFGFSFGIIAEVSNG